MIIKSLAELSNFGKSQIAYVLKNKESLLSSYEANAAGGRVLTNPLARTSEYADINEALYQWYNIACSKNVYSSGPQLTEKAKEIAERLGKKQFLMAGLQSVRKDTM